MRYNHASRLEDLCKVNNLRKIHEVPEQIRLILKEPIYMKPDSVNYFKCPDLFLNYYNSDWTVIELKQSRQKKYRAYEQIESGKKLLVDVFGTPLSKITGKIVIYTKNNFYWETVK